MTASTELGPDSAPLTRGERMARDVMHTLLIDSKPWVEIQANRREVIRATFENLDAADDFEGMLAAQMAVVHSIFLGTAWLSLDRARPEKDKAFYLRQAGQLMRLYRQGFDSLGKRQRERRALQEREKALRYFRGMRKRHSDEEASTKERDAGKEREKAILPRKAQPSQGAARETRAQENVVAINTYAYAPAPMAADIPALNPLALPAAPHRKQRLMGSVGLALAQGP